MHGVRATRSLMAGAETAPLRRFCARQQLFLFLRLPQRKRGCLKTIRDAINALRDGVAPPGIAKQNGFGRASADALRSVVHWKPVSDSREEPGIWIFLFKAKSHPDQLRADPGGFLSALSRRFSCRSGKGPSASKGRPSRRSRGSRRPPERPGRRWRSP